MESSFPSELEHLRAQGLARSLSLQEDFNGINLSSNDYLGLSHHPDVIKAATAAAQRYGIGGTSSRLLAGTTSLHEDLEKELASFLDKEAALVFSSGYHANTGVIPALAGPDDVIFFDRLCHASLVDGVRLSRARFFSFEHNDMDDLKKGLAAYRSKGRRAFVISEGVFSMDGDKPPLDELVNLAKAWDALTYLDEAHTLGLFGPEGRGVAAQMGLLSEIDLYVGTLSKSMGGHGGFVASSKTIIDLLVSKSRTFIYTTALPALVAAGTRSALSLLKRMDDRRLLIQETAQHLRDRLTEEGFSCLNSMSQIIPVWTGDIPSTKKLSAHLLSRGFFVPSIRPPTVPAGEGRVRLSLTFDVINSGLKALEQAFHDYPARPRRNGKKIVQTL